MAIALVVSTKAASADGGSTAVSSAINTTGANFIACGFSALTGSAGHAVTDNKSNTFTARTKTDGAVVSILFECANPNVGTGHVFTFSGTGTIYPGGTVAAFSGVTTSSPFDAENGNSASNAELIQTGSSGTPVEDGELFITHLAMANAVTSLAIDNSFTIAEEQQIVGGQSFGTALAYKLQTTAAAINPQWSWAGPINVSTRIATYKAAAAGGGGFQAAWARNANTVLRSGSVL